MHISASSGRRTRFACGRSALNRPPASRQSAARTTSGATSAARTASGATSAARQDGGAGGGGSGADPVASPVLVAGPQLGAGPRLGLRATGVGLRARLGRGLRLGLEDLAEARAAGAEAPDPPSVGVLGVLGLIGGTRGIGEATTVGQSEIPVGAENGLVVDAAAGAAPHESRGGLDPGGDDGQGPGGGRAGRNGGPGAQHGRRRTMRGAPLDRIPAVDAVDDGVRTAQVLDQDPRLMPFVEPGHGLPTGGRRRSPMIGEGAHAGRGRGRDRRRRGGRDRRRGGRCGRRRGRRQRRGQRCGRRGR